MSTPNLSRSIRRVGLIGAAVATLALTGCAGDDPGAPPALDPTPDSITPPDTEGPTEEPAPPAAGDGDVPDVYAGVLAAIPLAESSAGGPAFEVDDGDGGIWEVHVAVGGDDIEVHVDPTGQEVLRSDREADLDSDDAAGLEAASIDLTEAIRIAIAEYGGTAPLDDAGIDRDRGGFAWEVAFQDDVEVYVDVTDGSVIRVE
ncbi:PepSY domain-containing protein [Microbacterium album]|uniref:PepSY domain-containing protein n=1 Tax=Microbacterium album TaxID=2053191 RepID=A0A917IDX7_9MICO|nr:PepSY domain-containing protein [Microbacterium album]GGH43307.1 hypothetical protein GCM10010921_17110 [Microbacterium album]